MNERLSQLRSCLGLTLKEFGAALGLSVSSLSGIEKGRTPVQERHIKLILSAFPNVSEAWLRDGEGEMFLPPPSGDALDRLLAEITLPEILQGTIRRIAQEPPEVQRAVNQFMQDVLKNILQQRTTGPDMDALYREAEQLRQAYIAESSEERGQTKTDVG